MSATYVALDLETTGLEPDRHEIIEVAAVKFKDIAVLDTFETFVKPVRDIPHEIQELTGITPADVRLAPPFAAIAGDLLNFVGDSILVIQNAAFDLAFLRQHGLPLPNRALDTLELAKVLLGGLPERNLGALATHLGVRYEAHHRALPDAHAAKDVFLALRKRAGSLDYKTLAHLAALGARSEWSLQSFFQEIIVERVAEGLIETAELRPAGGLGPSSPNSGFAVDRDSSARRGRRLEARPPGEEGRLVDTEVLARLLGPDGAFARTLPGFEHRPEQVAMMRAVATALNRKQHLIVEAGTGTGKSMAYLLPALTHAVQTGQPVVVATNTIALQDQVVSKDLPALLNALADLAKDTDAADLPSFQRAKYTVLKGRGNYLCPRRWNAALGGATAVEPGLLARITVWREGTTTGDRAELNLNPGEAAAWRRLSAETDNCPASQCAQVPGADCFLQRARRRAAEADIVVVNHALLLADMVAGSGVIPEYDALVVDEAHHLEDVATDMLGFRIRHADVEALFDRLYQEAGGRGQGLLADLESSLRLGGPLLSAVALQHIAALRHRVQSSRPRTVQFFGHLADFMSIASEGSDYGRRIRLTPAVRHHHLWERVEQAWAELALVLKDLIEGIDRLGEALKPLADSQPQEFEESQAEMEIIRALYGSLLSNGEAVIARPDPEWVSWAAGSSGEGESSAVVYAAPIEVGPVLARDLFQQKSSVVLTSATLRAADGFGYIESRLGVEKPVELAVESSFPYKETALLLLPQDVPDPRRPDHHQAMEQALADLCLASNGRALVLFTSYAALQGAHRSLREALEPRGLRVLAQGAGMSVQRMLERLRARSGTVLLGTSSFWEGVDVVGDALSLLVITRLPFSVPTEPVFQARSERFEDPFAQYAVPQAVLRFRQGFGRLIRSRTDRGVCAVLDPRVGAMRYGRSFLEALPPATVLRCTLREAPAHVATWLAR